MKTLMVSCLFLLAHLSYAQVDDIIAKSNEHSSSSEGKSSSDSFDEEALAVHLVAEGLELMVFGWQPRKLSRKNEVPGMVSLDIMLQMAVQPSSYYLIHPRIRGNWGLFSTDFRMSYLLEHKPEGGVKHLHTADWQILQLNIVTARTIGFRIGGGILYEAFGGHNTFGEGTAALTFQSKDLKWGGVTEYRWSEPRKEWNAHVQRRIFDSGSFHGYATLGFAYQRYYDEINVWGVQMGLVVRVFKW